MVDGNEHTMKRLLRYSANVMGVGDLTAVGPSVSSDCGTLH